MSAVSFASDFRFLLNKKKKEREQTFNEMKKKKKIVLLSIIEKKKKRQHHLTRLFDKRKEAEMLMSDVCRRVDPRAFSTVRFEETPSS